MRWGRRPVPEAVTALDAPGRLAWGLTTDGTPLVATSTALYVAAEPLPWTQVERVSWRPPELVVREVAEVEGGGRLRTFVLAEDDRLAEVVRARVTSSIGWSERRRLEPAGHVRVVGRRVPGADSLQWQVVYEQAEDAADPATRTQVAELVESLRRTLG